MYSLSHYYCSVKISVLVACLSVTSLTYAQSVDSDLPLGQLYTLAAESNPSLLQQQKLYEAEQKRIKQARADLLPQINLEARAGKTYEDNYSENLPQNNDPDVDPNTLERVIEAADDNYDDDQLQITGSLALIDAVAWTNLKAVKSQVSESALEYRNAEQQLLADLLTQYLTLLRANEQKSITENELASTQLLADLSRSRFDQGLGNRIDYLDAEARLGQLQADLLEADNNIRSARSELREIVGESLYPERVLGPFSAPRYPDMGDYLTWRDQAVTDNLDLLFSRQQLDTAELNLKNAKAGHLPSLSFDASYLNEKDELSAVGPKIDNATTSLELVLDVPIFSGFRTQGLSQERRYRYQAAQQGVDNQLRQLDDELQRAFDRAQTSRSRLSALEKAYESARISQTLHVRLQEEGLESQLDTLAAERQLYDIERSALLARYDYVLALIVLERISGNIDLDFAQTINDLLIVPEQQTSDSGMSKPNTY